MLSIHELTGNDDPPVDMERGMDRNGNQSHVDGLKAKLIKIDMTDDVAVIASDDVEGANSEDAQVIDCTSAMDVSIPDTAPKTGSNPNDDESSAKEPKSVGSSPMAQLISWLRTSDLNAFYAVTAGSIKLKCKLGLKGHPVVIGLLASFFQYLEPLRATIPEETVEPQVLLVPNRFIILIACLLHESTSTCPEVEIEEILLPFSDLGLAPVKLSFELNEGHLLLPEVIAALGKQRYYGLFDAHQPRNKNACMVWEVDLELLPAGPVRNIATLNKANREKNCSQLNAHYRKILGIDESPTESNKTSTNCSRSSTPVKATPVTKPHTASKKASATVAAGAGNKKLSNFFTVFKKTPVEKEAESVEWFQPLTYKDCTVVAPINYFGSYMVMEEDDTQLDPLEFWDVFRRRAKKSPVAHKGKRKACCPNWIDGPEKFVMKLIQFQENNRPAYFGTWRKTCKTVNGRRPFAHEEEIDYEYDSDDDWEQEANVDDAESILSEDEDDDEEDEEDCEEGGSSAAEEEMEGKSWLVPAGYLSDEEGEMVSDEVTSFKRQSYKKGQKKRYVQLSPVVSAEDMMRALKLRKLANAASDPFSGASLPDRSKIEPAAKKVPFPEANLADLAKIAEGSPFGVAKLYEIFSQKFGLVSKKQFELRLNQIASKTKGTFLEGHKPVWIVRDEYRGKLLATDNIGAMDQAADVIMLEPTQ